MEWIALQHALLSHLPVALGLLLPLALLAAQRPGRGIRPWWTAARYLGWAGIIGTLGAFLSGLASSRLSPLLPRLRLSSGAFSGSRPEALLLQHALLGGVTLLVGVAALWAMTRPRKDHESLGFLALLLGLAWCAGLLTTGERGHRLAHPGARVAAAPLPIASAPVQSAPARTRAAQDPDAAIPVRALDFASLEPLHPEPVKSLAHGRRWVRAWASSEAVAAYRAGQALPQGAFVVLSSAEDRWGRPGPDLGPLYALEMKAAGPAFTFYWPRIPVEDRPEFGGDSRAYWRGSDSHLEACRTCHSNGLADPAKRSRWRPKRIVPDE